MFITYKRAKWGVVTWRLATDGHWMTPAVVVGADTDETTVHSVTHVTCSRYKKGGKVVVAAACS